MKQSDFFADFNKRINIICFTISIMVCALIADLIHLQIMHNKKYTLLSEKNRIRLSPLIPPRGKILDRNGNILAENLPFYTASAEKDKLSIFQEQISNFDKILPLNSIEKEQIFKKYKQCLRFSSVNIKDNLSWDQYAKISLNLPDLPGITLERTFARIYNSPYACSHVVGYVAGNKEQLFGKTGIYGIEKSCESLLRGTLGNQQFEVNAIGRKIRQLNYIAPIAGDEVSISIDISLQKYAYDLLYNSQAQSGACIVIDLETSELLCLTSVPGFDINLLANKITTKQWNALLDNEFSPLTNKAIAASYPPGSILKIPIALIALQNGVITPTEKIFCNGQHIQNNHAFHCWKRNGHGYLNMEQAIAQSCDVYFYEIAKRLGADKISDCLKQFSFGTQTGIELNGENPGFIPTKLWKFMKYGKHWLPYETLLLGIGQGATLATPLQLAVMMSRILTNNYEFKPTIFKQMALQNKIISKTTICSPEHISIIKNALLSVCSNPSGTAYYTCNTQYGIFGKTATSQVRRLKEGESGKSQLQRKRKERDHAFFVGAAPSINPRYAVCVFVEHGCSGSSSAAPIARKIFDKLILGL